MKFVEATNYDARVVCADGVASIERVSQNRIRVGFYTRHIDGDEIENKIVVYLDWDRDVYIKLFEVYASVFHTVVQPNFPITKVPPMEQRN